VSAPAATAAAAVIAAFNDAFNAHDLDRLAHLLTEDCTFEDTVPPDGTRHEGRDRVLAAFAELFAVSPRARFTSEGAYVVDTTVVALWRYDWGVDGAAGQPGHVRGVDLFTISGGRVAAKRSYVKG